MYKRLIPALLACLLLLSACGGAAEADAGAGSPTQVQQDAAPDETSVSYQLGRIEREYLSDPDDTPAIVGAHFTVTAGELEKLTAEQALIDPDTAAETAAAMLVEKYSLYARACADGAEVSDDEIDAIVEENVREFAAADDRDYADFLAGLGQTSEEYQRSRADALKITETIAAWRQAQHEAFAAGHADLDDDALAQAWNAHYAALTEKIIADEHVEYLQE